MCDLAACCIVVAPAWRASGRRRPLVVGWSRPWLRWRLLLESRYLDAEHLTAAWVYTPAGLHWTRRAAFRAALRQARRVVLDA